MTGPTLRLKSRGIIIAILTRSGLFSEFDKTSSYDRLFPYQDYHSGKGLGNLIALPLPGQSLKAGNTCYVDELLRPYQDQWAFLASVNRASLWTMVAEVRNFLCAEFEPNGYNVGFNVGQTAGQTIHHVHIQIIPRFEGDMDDPTGGVRHVIPEKEKYLKGSCRWILVSREVGIPVLEFKHYVV